MTSYDPSNQLINCPGMINLRDLGGMPLEGDMTFAKNIFFRSGSPSISGESCVAPLKNLGVKTVIDLRSEAEVKNYGNPFISDEDTNFYNVSLFLGDPDSDEDPTMLFLRTHKLGDFYVLLLEELSDRVIEVLRILKDSQGTCLFHCAHGKDRTGVIAAILYLISGANRDDIIHNYEVSYDYAKDFLDPLIEAREEEMKHTLRSDRINMEIFLNYIDEKYDGDITKFLIKAGMTIDEINELKNKCIN